MCEGHESQEKTNQLLQTERDQRHENWMQSVILNWNLLL